MLIGEIKKIGKREYLVQGTGNTIFEALQDYRRASFYDVGKCGICGSDNLILNSRISGEKKFEYAEVKCLDCKAQLVFGKAADNSGTMYLRKSAEGNLDWKAYTPKD